MNQIKQKHVPQQIAGCGLRRQGKLYMYSDMQKHIEKYPFGYFLYDPPILVEDPAAWGICPQGISYIYREGYYHAMDWIGENNYPNAADILEEAYNQGGSGLVPLNIQVGKLTPGKSRRLLIHPRGYLNNFDIYDQNYFELPNIPHCFKPKGTKHEVPEPCASLHWQSVDNGDSLFGDGRLVNRKIGSTNYTAVRSPKDTKPDFAIAIVGWFPIDELHLVNSDDKEEIQKALDLLNKLETGMPTYLTDF